MSNANGYNSGVKPFEGGQVLSARELELMRQAAQRALPRKGVGTMVTQTPNGSIVRSLARTRRGGKTEELYPFSPYNPPWDGEPADKPDDWALTYRLIPGNISGVWPSNIMDEFEGMAEQQMRIVYLEVDVHPKGYPASAEIAEDNDLPVNDEPLDEGMLPAKWHVALFGYDSDEKRITKVYRFVRSNLLLRNEVIYPGCTTLTRTLYVTSA